MELFFKSTILAFFITLVLIILSRYIREENLKLKEVKYNVSECYLDLKECNKYYFENNKTIKAYIAVNCCIDDIKVYLENSSYKIEVIEKDGSLCRCICCREIVIYEAKDIPVILYDYDKTTKMLNKGLEFCGISTFAYCDSDKDCITTGCNGEICTNVNDNIFSTLSLIHI